MQQQRSPTCLVLKFYCQPPHQMDVCKRGCAHTYTHMCTLTKAHFPSLWCFPSVSKNASFQSFLRPFCFCEALRLYPMRAWQEAYVSYSSSWARQLCFSRTTWENVPSLNQPAQGCSGAKYSLCCRASLNVSTSLSSSLYPGSCCVCVRVCVCVCVCVCVLISS